MSHANKMEMFVRSFKKYDHDCVCEARERERERGLLQSDVALIIKGVCNRTKAHWIQKNILWLLSG